jgi:uncharacterized protein (TIGR03000 family)
MYFPPASVAPGGAKDPRDAEVQKLRDQVDKLQKQIEQMKKKDQEASAPAKVTVRLPADAALFVDNVACPLTSDNRSFHTPALQPGQKYYYVLRTEVTRDGAKKVETQKVEVTAGQQVTVTFADPAAVASSNR